MANAQTGKGGLYLLRGLMGRCPACGEGRMQITAIIAHSFSPPDTS